MLVAFSPGQHITHLLCAMDASKFIVIDLVYTVVLDNLSYLLIPAAHGTLLKQGVRAGDYRTERTVTLLLCKPFIYIKLSSTCSHSR